jgi:hypothetical protein
MRQSPPQTQSTPHPAPGQMMQKAMKNARGKSHPQQWKMSSKATKGKKLVEANPILPTAMMHANLKIQMGKLMLTVDMLSQADKSCVNLRNYYINNYKKKRQHKIGGFKEKHFLVGEGIFLISWSDLYDLFTLDALDISLMHCFAL